MFFLHDTDVMAVVSVAIYLQDKLYSAVHC